MDGMDVGTPIEEQHDDFSRPSDDRAVKRRASCAVAAVDECRVGIEELADAFDVVGFSRQMNRMIRVGLGRRDSTAACAGALEERGDRFMTAISGHVDQAVAVERRPVRFRASVEQDLHRFKMPFTHRELNGCPADAVVMGQGGTTFDQTTQGGHIAGPGRCDDGLDVGLGGHVWIVGIDHAR